MNKYYRTAHNIASSPFLIIPTSIASLVCGVWLLIDKFNSIWPILFFILFLFLFFSVNYYSIFVRRENNTFKKIPEIIHNINHSYRDILCEMFFRKRKSRSEEELLNVEEKTLRGVCQRIQKIFTNLISRDCMITIKLITKDKRGRRYCETYVRGEENCERDNYSPKKFDVGTGKNTAFDESLKLRNNRDRSHFHSPDLTAEEHYSNERQGWQNYYQSAIVVPIRYFNELKRGTLNASEDIGFLCVDTLSRNRLNNTYHVDLLASFADQMYNFMCLMRGNFKIS